MPAQAQDGGAIQRVDSYQFPAGHVGHLTEGQQGQLTKFRDLCAQKGYYTPATGSSPASHDDETLLRYLRARKFVPTEAWAQFKDTEDWRKENQIDKLYETIDLEDYDRTRRLYPQWLGRRDKRGIPLYLFEVAHLDSKAVSDNEKSKGKTPPVTTKVPPKMLTLFALYENLTRFALPLCSAIPDRPSPETPISQSNNIVDISNVGLRQFWNLKAHMQDASLLATAHYPETLDRIFIIGAPSFFPTVWGWIKRWFDPVTVSKIFILSAADAKKTLLQYIDEENIPKKYGGKLDFKFGDLPKLEPAIADAFEWKEDVRSGKFRTFPTGPIKWQSDESGNLNAVAVGSENGKPRNRVIAVLPSRKITTADAGLRPGLGPNGTLERTVTTTGEATHPPTPPASVTDRGPPDADFDEGKSADASLPDTSRAGTYTVPFRDEKPASPPTDTRQGTSATRLEQQQDTHAEGAMEEGTPEVRHGAAGDKVHVMEPNTVGQAPKEHHAPEAEEPAPGVVDQAKDYAGLAYQQATAVGGSVLAAVGLGGVPKQEAPTEEPVKHEDPAVDQLKTQTVEEFLREKNTSGAPVKAEA